jgi:hypothetical protein
MTIKQGDRVPIDHFKKIVTHAALEITSGDVSTGEKVALPGLLGA